MPLHPKLEEFLREVKRSNNKPFEEMSIEEMRQATKNFKVFQGECEEIHKVLKRTIKNENHEYNLKIYQPLKENSLPVVLFFHSGGFVKGDVEFSEAFCRKLANGSNCIVVSVNYSLAPEYPYPTALEDSYHALCWVHQHAEEFGGDPSKIVVAGESSGGNLAAAISIMSHCKKGPSISFQVLIYPQLDYTFSFPSHKLFEKGYFLTEEALAFYAKQYLPENIDKKEQYVSPYFTKHYKQLPPAYLITAEYDPLRDEGEAFAKNLKKAGVSVTHHRFPGMVHGFVSMVTLVEEARQAIQMICDTLQSIFRKGGHRKSA